MHGCRLVVCCTVGDHPELSTFSQTYTMSFMAHCEGSQNQHLKSTLGREVVTKKCTLLIMLTILDDP